MTETDRLEPGGQTAYPLAAGDPGNYRLPEVHTPAEPPTRWRDLPPAEQIRRKVEDQIRYVAQRHGRLLTAQAILDRLKWPESRREQVHAAMNDPVTIANLRKLGILPDEVETWDEAAAGAATPTGRQMDALDAIFERIDPEDPRPLTAILREHKIDLKTWNGWLADPMFAGYVRDRATKVFGDRAHEVDIALMRRAVGGDVAAMKLILELQGRIKQAGDAVDVNALLARVVEIIDMEVDDRATKLRIASRLEALADSAQRRAALPTGPKVIAGELG